MSPAIESVSVKKHNRVKSVSKSGEDPIGSVSFSPPQPKGDPLSLVFPTPTVGSGHYSWCKLKQGEVCDYEDDRRREIFHGDELPTMSDTPSFFFSPYNDII